MKRRGTQNVRVRIETRLANWGDELYHWARGFSRLLSGARFVRFRRFHKSQDRAPDMLRQFRPGGHDTSQVGARWI